MEWSKVKKLFSWHKGGIRRRLLVWGLALLGLALILNTFAGTLYTGKLIKREAAELQKEVASRVGYEIEEFIRRRLDRLIDLSSSARLYELGSKEQRLLAILFLRNDSSFTEVTVMDDKGMEVVKVSERRVYLPADFSDQSESQAFKSAIRGESYVSPVYTSDKAEPYVTLAVPVKLAPREVIGVVSAEANLKILWQVIGDVKFGGAGYAYLVDARGNLIAHRDPSLVLKRTNLSHLREVQEFLRSPGSQDLTPVGEGPGIMGERVLSTYTPVSRLGGAVVLEEPVSVALAELRTLERYAFLLLGLGLLVGAFIIAWVSDKITRPIRELHRGAEIIGSGNLDYRVEIRSGDEIEELAQEFNEMGGELKSLYTTLEEQVKQRTRELSALYDVTSTVNQSLELEPVLHDVVKKITEIFHFDATRIFLFNDRMDELHMRASFEADPEFWARVRFFRRGQSVVGRVAETGEPLIFRDTLTDPLYQEISQSQGARGAGFSFLAVFPIKVKESSVGTIVCVGGTPRSLTPDEIRLIGSVADQIGVAVENANLFQETVKRANELSALFDVTTTVNRSLELEPVLQEVIAKITEIFHFDTMRIYLLNPQMDELHVRASFPMDREDVSRVRVFRWGQGVVGKVVETGEPIIFDDLQSDPRYRELSHTRNTQKTGHRFFAAFPIKAKLKTVGTVVCNGRTPRSLTSDEARLLTSMADQIGVAVENANLFTEVKNKTVELEKINQDLQEASRAKADFLAAMSHELRTPLNVIIGNTDLLKDGFFGEVSWNQREALEKILRHSQTLLKLINDVLTLTRMDAKKMTLDVSTAHLDEIIAYVRSYVEQLNRDNHLEIAWKVEQDLPSITTDLIKLEEILQNLIGNAFKFTPQGKIEVRVRDLPNEGRIEFTVTDTGIGIDESDLEKIFEQFHQLKEAHTGNFSGVGLGLNIVKRYLELMQGEIWVESQPGSGSTFTFTLPRSVQPN